MIKFFLFTIIFVLLPVICFSQSPWFSLSFKIADVSAQMRPFKTHVDMCKFNYTPYVRSGDYWFGIDTSVIDFNNIPDSLMSRMECSKFIEQNGDSVYYGNQLMAWENIFKIQIYRAGSSDTMTIVFPVRIKAFMTDTYLGEITFKPGYYELTDALKYELNENSQLNIRINKDYEWNGGERKIRLNHD